MSDESLSASLEDYLEAIHHIVAKKKAARAKDISKRLSVHSSSVTGALHALKDRDLVNYEPYDVVTLTPKGESVAREIVRRHEALHDFFVKVLSLDEKLAEEAACKMEHEIPREVLERLIKFAQFVEVCPRGGASWVKGFGYFCKFGPDHGNCDRCMQLAQKDATQHQSAKESRSPIPLVQLKNGERGVVAEILQNGVVEHRLGNLGIGPGSLIEVMAQTSGADDLELEIEGNRLSCPRGDAAEVVVVPLYQ